MKDTIGVILFTIGGTLLGLAIAFGVTCLYAWVAMLLWNWVIVGVFGAPVLHFWTAWGFFMLMRLLFRGSNAIRIPDRRKHK